MNGVLTGSRPARRRLSGRLLSLGVSLVAVCTLGLAPVSSADTLGDKKKLDADISQLRSDLDDTSRDLGNAFVKLQRTRAELPAAQRALTAAGAAQARANRHNEQVAMALAVARANEARSASVLAQNARDSTKVQDQLGNLARDAYQRGEFSGLSIALEATSPEEFTDRLIVMDTVMQVRGATRRGLDTMQAEGRAVRAHLVAVRQQVVTLKVQAEVALAQATAARETAAAAKTKLDLLYAAQARYAAGVAAKKANEVTNLQKMQARSNTLARVLAARARAVREAAARARAVREAAAREAAARAAAAGGAAAGGAAAGGAAAGGAAGRTVPGPVQRSRGGGFLRFPVNAPTSSEFGVRFHPVLHIRLMHEGLDFSAGCGSPVYAAADGEVIMAVPTSQTGGYGNQLVIDHGLRGGVDLTTTYSHLASFVVTGGHVSAGQVVGRAGTTGLSTGCHLHFETREDGTPVNPRVWL